MRVCEGDALYAELEDRFRKQSAPDRLERRLSETAAVIRKTFDEARSETASDNADEEPHLTISEARSIAKTESERLSQLNARDPELAQQLQACEIGSPTVSLARVINADRPQCSKAKVTFADRTLRSSRGGELLREDGFVYRLDKRRAEKSIWRCISEKKLHCKGRLWKYENGTKLLRSEHNHIPNLKKASPRRKATRIAGRGSTQSTEDPSQDRHVSTLPLATAPLLAPCLSVLPAEVRIQNLNDGLIDQSQLS